MAWHLFDETATITSEFPADFRAAICQQVYGNSNCSDDDFNNISLEQKNIALWQQVYNTIHQNDTSGRAVFANRIGGCDQTIHDVCNADLYSIYDANSSLYTVARSVNGMVATGNPAFIILQAFRANHSWLFMPTPAQIRGQMYAAIVHGATGLWLFVHYNQYTANQGEGLVGISPQINSSQWNIASQTNHEIETYKKVYLSKTSPDEYHVSVDHRFNDPGIGWQSPIHTILKDPGEGDTRYLLAVNMTSDQTQSQFSFSKNYSSITSLFDNRNISISGNSFTDSFDGYGVHLYKLSTQPPPASDPSPVGYYSSIYGDCTLSGWTCDHSKLNQPLQVDLYVNDATTNNQPVWVASPIASIEHNSADPAVTNACGGTNNHDFAYQLPADSIYRDGQEHTYLAFGINIDTNGNRVDTDPNGNPKHTLLNVWQSNKLTCTRPPLKSCNTRCSGNSQCQSGFCKMTSPLPLDWSCRNPSCSDQTDCTCPPPSISGDLNHDGHVDIFDLRQRINTFTNIFDYNLVVGNYGR